MNTSLRVHTRGLRRLVIVALAVLALLLPSLVYPMQAQAAAPTARVAAFSAGPATVVEGKTVTVAAQAQRVSGKKWVKAGSLTATIYFDPDGKAPNKALRTIKSNSSGYLKATFTASGSGKWSIRWAKQGSMAAASSTQKYVKVVAAPKPASAQPVSKWECPSWAPIKGNAPSRIYHLKGQQFYSRTTPEICFSTESAAVKAGYRKSKR